MIDTGAEANVILESQVPDKIRRLTKTRIQLQPYGSKLITHKGEFTAHTHWKDKKCKSTWIVVDDDDLPEKKTHQLGVMQPSRITGYNYLQYIGYGDKRKPHQL